MKRMESASFGLDQLPVTMNKHQQQVNDEQRHRHEKTNRDLTLNRRRSHDYDNLENIAKNKRKGKMQSKVSTTFSRNLDGDNETISIETSESISSRERIKSIAWSHSN